MSLDLGTLIAAIGGLFGILGYGLKKYIDFRLGTVSRFHEAKFDAAVALRGRLEEIDHAVMHVSKATPEYVDVLREHCAEGRRHARQSAALIGDRMVRDVREATDHALAYADERTDSSLVEWQEAYVLLANECDRLVRTVDIRPARGTAAMRD